MGPEHEYSIVDEELRALPIVDRVLKDLHGRTINCVSLPRFSFGKELQTHVIEARPNAPFKSPVEFEETMQEAVLTLGEFIQRRHNASLLGTGMHPLLRLNETSIWPHRHRQIYNALSRVFRLKRHGWLNIQSFQLNLSYADEKCGVRIHNLLANICAYLPALSASSPIFEGRLGDDIDNRLRFYAENQKEIPSITGKVIPEYVDSFDEYRKEIIGRYSADLASVGADKILLNQEWVNSRGVIFRFDRRALEMRVMDEQECIKSDVALSCFIRALARNSMEEGTRLLPHRVLVKDYGAIVRDGFDARMARTRAATARKVCEYLLRAADAGATEDEKKYLPVVQKRVKNGNLSDIIRSRVRTKSQKSNLREAIISVYLSLTKSLMNNEPYF